MDKTHCSRNQCSKCLLLDTFVRSDLRSVIPAQCRQCDFAQLALNWRRSLAIASTRSLSKEVIVYQHDTYHMRDTCILYKKVEQCRVRRGAALLHTAVSSNSELTHFNIIGGPQKYDLFPKIVYWKMAFFLYCE